VKIGRWSKNLNENALLIIYFYVLCSLFNDAFSSSAYISSNERMISELERIWKKAVVAQLKVLSRNLRGGTEGNHEKYQFV
jgi:hypothetical protein